MLLLKLGDGFNPELSIDAEALQKSEIVETVPCIFRHHNFTNAYFSFRMKALEVKFTGAGIQSSAPTYILH